MTTELEQPDRRAAPQVHNAVLVNPTGPTESVIRFDIARADIEHMRAEAANLSITGPDDKAGFENVFRLRQVVKRQRVAVEKKAKELKAPHVAYNRAVDSAMKELADPMEEVEDSLALKEKAYNDERERIAHQAMLAQQARTEKRIDLLRGYGFEWNPREETYEFGRESGGPLVQINFDDIKQLSDEDYQSTADLARVVYDQEVARVVAIREAEAAEAQRIAIEQQAEADRMAQQKKALDEQAAELRREQEKLREAQDEAMLDKRRPMLLAAGFTEQGSMFRYEQVAATHIQVIDMDEQRFTGFLAEVADAKKLKAQQKQAEAAQSRADKERQKRLAPDKKAFKGYLLRVTVLGPGIKLTQPESGELYDNFFSGFRKLISDCLKEIDAL